MAFSGSFLLPLPLSSNTLEISLTGATQSNAVAEPHRTAASVQALMLQTTGDLLSPRSYELQGILTTNSRKLRHSTAVSAVYKVKGEPNTVTSSLAEAELFGD